MPRESIHATTGDYTSISNWETTTDNDLVTSTTQYTAYMDESQTWSAGGPVFGDATTNATYYRRLEVDNASYRHDGKYNSGRTIVASTSSYPSIYEGYFEIFGMQFTLPTSGASKRGLRTGSGGDNTLVDSCIVLFTSHNTSSSNGGFYVEGSNNIMRNCICYGGGYGIYISGGTGHEIQNCTSIGSGTYGINVRNGAGPVTIVNSYFHGATAAANDDGTYDWTVTTSIVSDTSRNESGWTQSKAYNTTQFVNVTATTEDLHLPAGSGSALYNAGTSQSYTDDIDGDTRSAWSVGADDGDALVTIPLFMHHYRHNIGT